jgi:hypothetical protein
MPAPADFNQMLLGEGLQFMRFHLEHSVPSKKPEREDNVNKYLKQI